MKSVSLSTNDVVAGLSGAIAGTPQAMGFALIAGLSPIYGLYTAFVTTIIGAIFGNSSFMTVGPTNALSLVVFSTIGHLSGDTQVQQMIVLSLLVGVFYLIFGILRLGVLIRFVSNAVMTGFITGAGLLIIFGQVRHLNGYNPTGDHILARFADWVISLPQSQAETILISFITLVIILAIRQTQWKNYAILLSFVAASLAVQIFGWENVALVRDISVIPQGLPQVLVPGFALMPDIATAALAIAILGAVQSAAITNSIKEVKGKRVNVNRDFIGMGLANVAGGFLQSMPACGSLSRTAINVGAGGESRASNIWAGAFVAIFLLFFGPLIEYVTLPSLGVQLVLAAVSLIRVSEIKFIRQLHNNADIAMAATFLSAILLPLEYSIYIGVGISLVLYLISSANTISAVQLVPLDDGRFQRKQIEKTLADNEVTIFSIHGNLYFAAISTLENLLPDPSQAKRAIVILRLHENGVIASTGIHFLEDYDKALKENGGKLILASLSSITRTDILNSSTRQFHEDDLHLASDIVFEATTKALVDAKRVLASTE